MEEKIKKNYIYGGKANIQQRCSCGHHKPRKGTPNPETKILGIPGSNPYSCFPYYLQPALLANEEKTLF
jgi:hypothetical protein